MNECFPALIRIEYRDVDDCIARQKLQCVKSFGAPSTGLTPSYASACAAAYRSAACAGVIPAPDACRPPAGALPAGAPCAEDAQCAGRICNVERSAACGYCGERKELADGALCVYTSDCKDDSFCASGVCTSGGGPEGSACNTTEIPLGPYCAKGLFCGGKVCVRIGDFEGAPCSTTQPCDTQKGLLCSGSTRKAVTAVGTGETCGRSVGCAASGSCPASGDGIEQCLPAALDGEACIPENTSTPTGKHCKPPARCVDGACTIVDPATCK